MTEIYIVVVAMPIIAILVGLIYRKNIKNNNTHLVSAILLFLVASITFFIFLRDKETISLLVALLEFVCAVAVFLKMLKIRKLNSK